MGNCFLRRRLLKRSEEKFEQLRLRAKSFPAKVLEIYDGDTLTIGFRCNGGFWKSSMRIYGIDAPELKPKHQGRSIESLQREREAAVRSKNSLHKLLCGEIVKVQLCEKNTDKYGRLLGNVFLGKINVAEWMIKEGLARPYYGERKVNFVSISLDEDLTASKAF